MLLRLSLFFFWLLLFASCSSIPTHSAYQENYGYVEKIKRRTNSEMVESDFFLVFCVEARHLDYYSTNRSLFKTIAKHPSDASKNGDVGHAWIYLQGIMDGEIYVIEGGHSGELGRVQPKYFEGMMNYLHYGFADPSEAQKKCPREEPNPVKYLWASQHDGFFQSGSGRHTPTFAAKIELTEEQFLRVLTFISPENYDYSDYAITRNQCSSFVAKVGAIVDFPIDFEVTVPIEQVIIFDGRAYQLWDDPLYSTITFSSPDIVEKSLLQAVEEGRADNALCWYLSQHPETFCDRLSNQIEKILRFPKRLFNYNYL